MRKTLSFAICLWAIFLGSPVCAADRITVFAAASLTDALARIDAAYTARTGHPISVSFAASSTLARQIEAGAPADIFISADEKWMDYLAGKKLLEPGSRLDLLGNSLALIAPSDGPVDRLAIDRNLRWDKLLGPGERLAVADPARVPAGLYAKEALTNLGVWPLLESRLARAEDVRGALAFVERQQTPLGIVYATDARISKRVRIVAVFPASSHSPILYPAAIVGGAARKEVRDYFRFLRGPEARNVFRSYGFATPPN